MDRELAPSRVAELGFGVALAHAGFNEAALSVFASTDPVPEYLRAAGAAIVTQFSNKESALASAGNSEAAAMLGVLFALRGDGERAQGAFARGDELGDALSALGLAALLMGSGDLRNGLPALNRAAERGSAVAAAVQFAACSVAGKREAASAAAARATALGFNPTYLSAAASRRARVASKLSRSFRRQARDMRAALEEMPGPP